MGCEQLYIKGLEPVKVKNRNRYRRGEKPLSEFEEAYYAKHGKSRVYIVGIIGIGFTSNTNQPFLFDAKHYDLIKPYNWREDKEGYIATNIPRKKDKPQKAVKLHRLILAGSLKKYHKIDPNMPIDHISGCKSDNREQNIRLVTPKVNNSINKSKEISYEYLTERGI